MAQVAIPVQRRRSRRCIRVLTARAARIQPRRTTHKTVSTRLQLRRRRRPIRLMPVVAVPTALARHRPMEAVTAPRRRPITVRQRPTTARRRPVTVAPRPAMVRGRQRPTTARPLPAMEPRRPAMERRRPIMEQRRPVMAIPAMVHQAVARPDMGQLPRHPVTELRAPDPIRRLRPAPGLIPPRLRLRADFPPVRPHMVRVQEPRQVIQLRRPAAMAHRRPTAHRLTPVPPATERPPMGPEV